MNTMYAVAATRPEDMAKSRAWTKQFFSTAADLPIAFVLDGTPIGGIPEEWRPVSTRRRIDANIAETVFEGNHLQETITIHPVVARPDATYVFENLETGETKAIPGEDLISAGFTFALPPRSGAIWFYRTNA